MIVAGDAGYADDGGIFIRAGGAVAAQRAVAALVADAVHQIVILRAGHDFAGAVAEDNRAAVQADADLVLIAVDDVAADAAGIHPDRLHIGFGLDIAVAAAGDGGDVAADAADAVLVVEVHVQHGLGGDVIAGEDLVAGKADGLLDQARGHLVMDVVVIGVDGGVVIEHQILAQRVVRAVDLHAAAVADAVLIREMALRDGHAGLDQLAGQILAAVGAVAVQIPRAGEPVVQVVDVHGRVVPFDGRPALGVFVGAGVALAAQGAVAAFIEGVVQGQRAVAAGDGQRNAAFTAVDRGGVGAGVCMVLRIQGQAVALDVVDGIAGRLGMGAVGVVAALRAQAVHVEIMALTLGGGLRLFQILAAVGALGEGKAGAGHVVLVGVDAGVGEFILVVVVQVFVPDQVGMGAAVGVIADPADALVEHMGRVDAAGLVPDAFHLHAALIAPDILLIAVGDAVAADAEGRSLAVLDGIVMRIPGVEGMLAGGDIAAVRAHAVHIAVGQGELRVALHGDDDLEVARLAVAFLHGGAHVEVVPFVVADDVGGDIAGIGGTQVQLQIGMIARAGIAAVDAPAVFAVDVARIQSAGKLGAGDLLAADRADVHHAAVALVAVILLIHEDGRAFGFDAAVHLVVTAALLVAADGASISGEDVGFHGFALALNGLQNGVAGVADGLLGVRAGDQMGAAVLQRLGRAALGGADGGQAGVQAAAGIAADGARAAFVKVVRAFDVHVLIQQLADLLAAVRADAVLRAGAVVDVSVGGDGEVAEVFVGIAQRADGVFGAGVIARAVVAAVDAGVLAVHIGVGQAQLEAGVLLQLQRHVPAAVRAVAGHGQRAAVLMALGIAVGVVVGIPGVFGIDGIGVHREAGMLGIGFGAIAALRAGGVVIVGAVGEVVVQLEGAGLGGRSQEIAADRAVDAGLAIAGEGVILAVERRIASVAVVERLFGFRMEAGAREAADAHAVLIEFVGLLDVHVLGARRVEVQAAVQTAVADGAGAGVEVGALVHIFIVVGIARVLAPCGIAVVRVVLVGTVVLPSALGADVAAVVGIGVVKGDGIAVHGLGQPCAAVRTVHQQRGRAVVGVLHVAGLGVVGGVVQVLIGKLHFRDRGVHVLAGRFRLGRRRLRLFGSSGIPRGIVPGILCGSVPGTLRGSVPGILCGSVPGILCGSVPGILRGSVRRGVLRFVPSIGSGRIAGFIGFGFWCFRREDLCGNLRRIVLRAFGQNPYGRRGQDQQQGQNDGEKLSDSVHNYLQIY